MEKDQNIKILFDESSLLFILKAIGKKIDSQGYVIDAKTKIREVDVDGNDFKSIDLIGIVKQHYITSVFQLLKFNP